MDWEGRSYTMATTFIGHYSSGLVYWCMLRTPAPDIDNLKARIKDALAAVTEEMLEKTWREIEYRPDVLRATNGAHIDVY
jgi:hypothetical protein